MRSNTCVLNERVAMVVSSRVLGESETREGVLCLLSIISCITYSKLATSIYHDYLKKINLNLRPKGKNGEQRRIRLGKGGKACEIAGQDMSLGICKITRGRPARFA